MLEKLPESIGHALINQRAGMDNVAYNLLHRAREAARIELHSPAFTFNARLPIRYTADGEGVSPPLEWKGLPEGTASVVLMVEDADSPTPRPLVHAIVTGLERAGGRMEEGALDSPNHQGTGLATGQNSYLKHSWLPPDPPRGHGAHRYVFQLFALRAGPEFSSVPGRGALVDAILEQAIGVGCLIGTYERSVPQDLDLMPLTAS